MSNVQGEFDQFKTEVNEFAQGAFAGHTVPFVMFSFRQTEAGHSMHVMTTNLQNMQALALAASAVGSKLGVMAEEEQAKANPQ